MATGATGTPTTLGIPKLSPSADAPSGVGINNMMDAIDALLSQAPLSGAIAGIAVGSVPVWNGSAWIKPSGTPDGTKFLRDDGAWANVGSATYGTALPGSPVDGQQHILVDSTSAPTYRWNFRYNAGSASSFKWEFIGGTPKIQEGISGSTTSATLTTIGTGVQVPNQGDYAIQFGANLGIGTNTFVNWNLAVGNGTLTSGSYTNSRIAANNQSNNAVAAFFLAASAAAASTFSLLANNTNGTALVSVSLGWIAITPVRVI